MRSRSCCRNTLSRYEHAISSHSRHTVVVALRRRNVGIGDRNTGPTLGSISDCRVLSAFSALLFLIARSVSVVLNITFVPDQM
nr:TPA_asm: m52.4 sORF 2 [Murid betaherpesvirus 1]DBA07999.1 TPA_asm: m52.4 sORF 2 [Murid betaherpesvirus 1]